MKPQLVVRNPDPEFKIPRCPHCCAEEAYIFIKGYAKGRIEYHFRRDGTFDYLNDDKSGYLPYEPATIRCADCLKKRNDLILVVPKMFPHDWYIDIKDEV